MGRRDQKQLRMKPPEGDQGNADVNNHGPLPDLSTTVQRWPEGWGVGCRYVEFKNDMWSFQNEHIAPGGVYARLVTISALRSECR